VATSHPFGSLHRLQAGPVLIVSKKKLVDVPISDAISARNSKRYGVTHHFSDFLFFYKAE
jgi:hypothetical protein